MINGNSHPNCKHRLHTFNVIVLIILVTIYSPLSLSQAVVRDVFVDAPPNQHDYYLINGDENPVLYLSRGIIYRFFLDAPNHPFFVLDNNGNVYQEGIYGEDYGHTLGAFLWEVPFDAPPKLLYASRSDRQMQNTIVLTDGAPHMYVMFSSTELPHETNLTLPSPHIPSPLTFTINNAGTGDLSFLSPPSLLSVQEGLVLSGPALSVSSLAPGEYTTLDLQFDSAPFNVTLILRTNDVQVYYALNIQVVSSTLTVPMCEWGDWSEWSICSSSCGGGLMSKTRTCSCEASAGGEGRCQQQIQEATVPCSQWVCGLDLASMWTCEWDDWGEWSNCSRDCGKGEMWRKKICSCPHLKPNEYDYSFCEGSQPEEVLPCNTQDCCTWGDLGPWSACSEPCPNGVRVRSQMCTCSPSAFLYGFDETTCEGQPYQDEQSCSVGSCCEWTWNEWGSCNGTCMNGRKRWRDQYCRCDKVYRNETIKCSGVSKVEAVGCNDGEEGVICPHSPEYWNVHNKWPTTTTNRTLSCFDETYEPKPIPWTTLLSHPSDDTWHTLARYAIAASLSCASGASCPGSVQSTVQSSLRLLSISCEDFSNASETQARSYVSFLSSYTAGETDLSKGAMNGGDPQSVVGGGGRKGSGAWPALEGVVGEKYQGLVVGLCLVGVTVVVVLVTVVAALKFYRSRHRSVDVVGSGAEVGEDGGGGAGDSPSAATSEGEDAELQHSKNNNVDEQKAESDEPDALDVTTLEELHL